MAAQLLIKLRDVTLLINLDILPEYRSDTTSPLIFYIKCLQNSIKFDRAAGYFSSSGLSEASKGFARFIDNDGVIRLVVSPDFEPDDYDLLNSNIHDRAKIIEDKLMTSIENIEDFIQRDRISILAWLIDKEKLKIKIAIKRNKYGNYEHGIYHEKMGIFYDSDDNKIAFTGSSNESRGGIISNFEAIDVYLSWNQQENERIHRKELHFSNLWNNKTNYLDIFDLPLAVKKGLIKKRRKL